MDEGTRSDWIEWTAHNLASGVAEASIRAELEKSSFSGQEAEALVAEVERSPIYKATKRLATDVKKWKSLSDVLIKLESLAVDLRQVPRESGLSSQDFLEKYYSANRPVVLVDASTDWPALRKWNTQFLRTYYGDHTVTYQRGRSKADHRDSFIDHTTTGRFSDFIDLVEQRDSTNDYYLIAHDRLLDRDQFRPLLDDIKFDPRYFSPWRKGTVFFWLGPSGSRTPMHRDLGNVHLTQVIGRKHITLIPSMEMHKVYNESGYHSEVDFDDLSFDNYPLLRDAHISQVTLSPGETLFIPLGWWHHVAALDVSITVTGNNFCFENSFVAIF